MKTIYVKRTKYGLDGWVNGKLRHNGIDNFIDLSYVKGRFRMIIENSYGTVGWKLPGSAPVTTTSTGIFDSGAISTPTNYEVFWLQLDRLHSTFQSNLDSYGYSEDVVCKIVQDVNDSICISFF